MPIRFSPLFAASAIAALAVMAAPAAAQDSAYGAAPVYASTPVYSSAAPVRAVPQYDPAQREEWLAACEQQYRTERRWGWTGPLLGAGLGGLAGNRIAGRHDRTVGTVAGAVAGGLIGAAGDRSRANPRARAYCEAYLDRALADYSRWYASRPAPAPVAVAPVMQQRRCTETTTVTTEEVAGPARRSIPRRHRLIPAHDKRVRLY